MLLGKLGSDRFLSRVKNLTCLLARSEHDTKISHSTQKRKYASCLEFHCLAIATSIHSKTMGLCTDIHSYALKSIDINNSLKESAVM